MAAGDPRPFRAAARSASSGGLGRFEFDDAGECLERELVAVGPETADDSAGCEADIGMMAEALAPEDVREMNLDDRQIGGVERVEDRDGGMRQGAGIDDDAVGGLARLVDPVDQHALVV